MEINLSVKQANEKRGNTETAWIKLSNLGGTVGPAEEGGDVTPGPQCHPWGAQTYSHPGNRQIGVTLHCVPLALKEIRQMTGRVKEWGTSHTLPLLTPKLDSHSTDLQGGKNSQALREVPKCPHRVSLSPLQWGSCQFSSKQL